MRAGKVRNLIPVTYGLLVVVAFVLSVTAGVVVLVVGGMISGVLWSSLSGGSPGGRDRSARAEGRASRRSRS